MIVNGLNLSFLKEENIKEDSLDKEILISIPHNEKRWDKLPKKVKDKVKRLNILKRKYKIIKDEISRIITELDEFQNKK